MRDFTLIIPTHNRHSYLKRSVQYFKELDAEIIYCDSSTETYEIKERSNIRYLHLPGLGFAAKVLVALKEVNTRFVALCADDDFIIIESLYAGGAYLKENEKFKTIVGKYVSFNESFDGRFFEKYQELPQDILYDAQKNAAVFFSNYYQILWAMYQKDVLVRAFEIVNKAGFRNDNFIELTVGASACYEGGIKFIDEMWGVRENSAKDHWGTRHVPIVNVDTDPECRKDFLKFEKLLDEATCNGYARLVIKSYIQAAAQKSTIRSVVKKMIPAGLLGLFRKVKTAQNLSQKEAVLSAKASRQLTEVSGVIQEYV